MTSHLCWFRDRLKRGLQTFPGKVEMLIPTFFRRMNTIEIALRLTSLVKIERPAGLHFPRPFSKIKTSDKFARSCPIRTTRVVVRGTESLWTQRWREAGSNSQSHTKWRPQRNVSLIHRNAVR